MVFHPLSSLAETDLSRSEAGLGASGSNWPVISEENKLTTVATDLLTCDMKTCRGFL